MEANLFLLLAAGVLCGSGVYLMLDRAMTKMLLGILLLGNGANLLLLQAGGQAGSPPIDGRETAQYGENIADPLAQGMIRQYRYRTADVIEDDAEDTAIAALAARPGNAAAAPDHDASNDPATGRATKEGDAFGPAFFEEPVKEANDD